MSIPIVNGKDTLLTQNSGTLPDMSGALTDYFMPITITRVSKTVNGFQVKETPTTSDGRGVIQPFSAKQLAMKPEGQRAWNWFTLHCGPGLVLQPDEVFTMLGVQYRVKGQSDYSLYGYVQYELIEDYTGAGP